MADVYYHGGRRGFFVYARCEICNAQAKTFFIGENLPENWTDHVACQNAALAWNNRAVFE
jgi:hypothetical protein